MPKASVNIRMDSDLKLSAEKLFAELGLNMSVAFNMFARQAVREHRIPFTVTADPFYSAKNQAALMESFAQAERGEFITKTLEELESMAE